MTYSYRGDSNETYKETCRKRDRKKERKKEKETEREKPKMRELCSFASTGTELCFLRPTR